MEKIKHPLAVEWGKLFGKRTAQNMTPEERQERSRKAGRVGGMARAKALTRKRRQEIGRMGAAAREANRRKDRIEEEDRIMTKYETVSTE